MPIVGSQFSAKKLLFFFLQQMKIIVKVCNWLKCRAHKIMECPTPFDTSTKQSLCLRLRNIITEKEKNICCKVSSLIYDKDTASMTSQKYSYIYKIYTVKTLANRPGVMW